VTAFGANSGEQERILSYLPLSHVAGMMVDIIAPLVCTAIKPGYGTVYFSRPMDLKSGALKQRLLAVRPTIFLGVPRVWEKFMEGELKRIHGVFVLDLAHCRCSNAGCGRHNARRSQEENRRLG
jgi:long-subunit acyl-CoA synthetase (AMP-forming)